MRRGRLEGEMGFWDGDVEGKRQEPRVEPSEVVKSAQAQAQAQGRQRLGMAQKVEQRWEREGGSLSFCHGKGDGEGACQGNLISEDGPKRVWMVGGRKGWIQFAPYPRYMCTWVDMLFGNM